MTTLADLYEALVNGVRDAAPDYQVLADEWFTDWHPPCIICAPVGRLKLRDKSFTSARATFEVRIIWDVTTANMAVRIHEALEPSDPESLIYRIEATLSAIQFRSVVSDEIVTEAVQIGNATYVQATISVACNT